MGCSIYFGYPQAHEDDAERAVRAGLAIIDAVARLDVQSVKLQARVGIATGLVVVGDLIGEGSAQEQSVVGETPNLAARLQTLAEPDAVVIAAGTRRLVGDLFEYRDLGTVEVKGIAAPVPAWQVLRQSVVASRFEALRATSMIPLVGRDEEMELLLRRWARAKMAMARSCCCRESPGSASRVSPRHCRTDCGRVAHKAALFRFAAPSRQPASPVYRSPRRDRGNCSRRSAGNEAGEAPRAIVAIGTRPDRNVRAARRSARPADRRRHSAPVVEPQHKRALTFRALLQQLDRLSRREPVLMLFEDVHWIDPTSRDLLGQIVEQAPRLRLLLVVTARPEFRAPWSSAAQVTVLALSRLGAREGRALADHIAGGKRLPDEIVAQIVDRTDGVPLFVEELTKTVLESGLLREQNGLFVSDGALSSLAVPTSLHGSLMARLDRLGPAKQIAQFGAAIGRQFSHELVAAVAQLPEAQLGEALDQLVGSELVFQRGLPPHADYVFKHALVQDAAYSTLLRSRRQELHARIAAALERGQGIAPEMLAHHFGEAGEAEKAAHNWLEAGRRALRRSANTEAIAHLTKGIGALTGIPKSEATDRSELQMQLFLGPVLSATRGWSAPEAERAYRRAEVLAQELGADRERFDAVWGLWMIHNTGNEPVAALGITDELFQIADRLDDPALRMEAHHAAWACAYTLGDNAATIEHMRQGLAIYQSEKHGAHAFSYGGHDTAVCGKAIGGTSLWALGYPDQAVRSTDFGHRFGRIHGPRPEPGPCAAVRLPMP